MHRRNELLESFVPLLPLDSLGLLPLRGRAPNRYTSPMDSVRFGRALGFGARSAAKALAGAAASATEAATAPSPTRPQTSSRSAAPPPATPAATATQPLPTRHIASAAETAARATRQARETRKGIARGTKRFGESVWGPFAKLSGILWLEITGSFFGIFALFAASAVWTHRADIRPTPLNHDARLHLVIFLGMTLVFGYFCISSFVRAYRK